jgi:hypothetical protein
MFAIQKNGQYGIMKGVVMSGPAQPSRAELVMNNVLTLHKDHVLDVSVWMWDDSRLRKHRTDTYARLDDDTWNQRTLPPNIQQWL